MRRSGIVDRRGDPPGQRSNGLELERDDGQWRRGGKHPALDRRIVQPYDPPFAMIELGPVVIVGFCVAVNDGVRVIGIRLVEMLGRQGVKGREARRERKRQDCPPERPRHVLDYGQVKCGCARKNGTMDRSGPLLAPTAVSRSV